MAGLWDQLVGAVVRPPRDLYAGEDDLVGARRAAFRLGNKKYYRQDVVLENSRGQKLQASHYRPCVVASRDGRLPCVIYCHCNSGSRRDAEEILYHLLPKSITVFALDFAGSGLSEGSYVTLGAHEVDDLAAAVAYLREEGSTSTIGLWGRSMGAVTALLYSQRDPSIAGMVLDSPFSRLSDLMMELATDQTNQLRIPKPLLKVALAMMRRSVKKRAGFSIDDVSPLDKVFETFIPALFGHARDDTFVNKHHSERMFAAYAGDKNFITFEGDHNSVRPDFFYSSALIFLLHALHVEELVGPDLDLAALPEGAAPHMVGRENSIYVAAGTAGTAGRPSSGSQPASPPGHQPRALSPPWDQASLALAGAEASAALAAERQGSNGVGVAPGSGGAGVLPSAQGLSGGMGGALGAAGTDADLLEDFDEDAALQQALELSLLDLQQQQQQPGGGQLAGEEGGAAVMDGSAPAEHRRYNPLYSTSGPANPLFGQSAGSEAPSTREDEEEMLARAIAESLAEVQLQGGDGQQQTAAAGAGAAVSPPARASAASPTSKVQPRPLPGEWRVQLQQQAQQKQQPPAQGLAAMEGAAAQGSVARHSQQEAEVARAASAELHQALSGMVAAAAAGQGAQAPPAGQQQQQGGLPLDEEERLQLLREQAAKVAAGNSK